MNKIWKLELIILVAILIPQASLFAESPPDSVTSVNVFNRNLDLAVAKMSQMDGRSHLPNGNDTPQNELESKTSAVSYLSYDAEATAPTDRWLVYWTIGGCWKTVAWCNNTVAACNKTDKKCNASAAECNKTVKNCNQTDAACNGTDIICNGTNAICQATEFVCDPANCGVVVDPGGPIIITKNTSKAFHNLTEPMKSRHTLYGLLATTMLGLVVVRGKNSL